MKRRGEVALTTPRQVLNKEANEKERNYHIARARNKKWFDLVKVCCEVARSRKNEEDTTCILYYILYYIPYFEKGGAIAPFAPPWVRYCNHMEVKIKMKFFFFFSVI